MYSRPKKLGLLDKTAGKLIKGVPFSKFGEDEIELIRVCSIITIYDIIGNVSEIANEQAEEDGEPELV